MCICDSYDLKMIVDDGNKSKINKTETAQFRTL